MKSLSYYLKSKLLIMFVILLLHTFFIYFPGADAEDLPGNIHLGPLEVHPGISISEEYIDNIFNEATNEKGSAVTKVAPGIILNLPIRRHSLTLDYRVDIIEAKRFHEEYDTDSHFINTLLNLDFNRLTMILGDNWAWDSTPPDYESDIRNNYEQNRAFFEAYYKLPGRYKLKTFYYNTYRNFDSFRKSGQSNPRLDNYMENEVGIDLYYRILPLTSIILEYGFKHINNTDMGFPTTDSDTHRIWFGFSWDATAKIEGIIKGGYVERDYEGGKNNNDPMRQRSYKAQSDDWDGFGMEGEITYKFSSFTTFNLIGFRRLFETSITKEEGDYGTLYITTGGMILLTHQLNPKLSFSADISYFNDDYQEKGLVGKKRSDDKIGFGVGVNYKIQDWFTTGLKYSYFDSDSNINLEDSRVKRIMLTFSFIF